MKCEKMQELILTDYADGELDTDARLDVEGHIRACASCRQLEAVMRQKAREPLEHLVREEPPAYIWGRVKQAISSGPVRPYGVFEDARELVGRIFMSIINIPRPVVAFAATAMVIIAIMIAQPIAERRAVDEYLGEQISFIASLDTDDANGDGMFDTDISTGTEKFM